MALQTLSGATPTEAIHWPDVLRRAARAVWQQAVEIDDCSRQNSAYRSALILSAELFVSLQAKSFSVGEMPGVLPRKREKRDEVLCIFRNFWQREKSACLFVPMVLYYTGIWYPFPVIPTRRRWGLMPSASKTLKRTVLCHTVYGNECLKK